MKKSILAILVAGLFLTSCAKDDLNSALELNDVAAKTKKLDANHDDSMDEGTCETAFGRYCDCANLNTCFSEFGISRWGWSVELDGVYGTKTYGLYAGAGQCDLEKGTEVGNVKVTFNHDGSVYYDQVNINSGYELQEFHFYAGDTPTPIHKNGRPTVAPGQFYNQGDYNDDGKVYVILHAVVCGDY